MNRENRFDRMMQQVTRLTRSGKLDEATAAIQRLLGPSAGHGHENGAHKHAPFEGDFRVIDDDVLEDAHRAPPVRFRTNSNMRATMDPQYDRQPVSGLGDALPDPSVLHTDAQYLGGSFRNAAGTRAYKLYVPSGYRAQGSRLVVMLHGCTQSPDDFSAGTGMNQLAEERACLVLYPAQARAANAHKCWNWFKGTDQQRDAGEPSIIAGLTREIVTTYRVDPSQVYVAGLSAGGAMAAVMGATYPDLYSGVGVHSGLAYGAACDLQSALAAMKGRANVRPISFRRTSTWPDVQSPRMIVFHGDRDTVVHPRNGEQLILRGAEEFAAATTAKPRMSRQAGQIPGGHAYTRDVYRIDDGLPFQEHWIIHGAGHAWSGGSPHGSHTDPKGPNAAREMLRFFEERS